jgi:predicted TIM-barrel fold metal-dependent hydrolase
MLWGSDWPYIGLVANPRVEALVDLFNEWTGDAALRQQIFVTNPAALFEPT